MSYLLDTNVVSEIRKKVPDPGVSAWFASVPDDELFLSVLVVGEIRQGIERLARRDLAQAEIFEQWLGRLVHAYGDRIVPITARVAEQAGVVPASDRRRSGPRGQRDAGHDGGYFAFNQHGDQQKSFVLAGDPPTYEAVRTPTALYVRYAGGGAGILRHRNRPVRGGQPGG